MGYNPGSTTVVPQYVVKKTGDPFFVTAYPEPYAKAGSLAQCKKLSPKGVELVATEMQWSQAPQCRTWLLLA